MAFTINIKLFSKKDIKKDDYTWQFMANLEHPGLCNRILAGDDFSDLKIGAKVNQTGSAWKAGFDIIGFFIPHWLLTIMAALLFTLVMIDHLDYFPVNPTILQMLSIYGLIHVIASALGFFSQGSISWGLIVTGTGYLIFLVASLRRQ